MITAFIRIEGRPLGVIANNPMHLGGAIDAELFFVADNANGDDRDLRIPLCSIAPSGELPFITADELGSMTFDIGISTKDTSTPQIIIAGQDVA